MLESMEAGLVLDHDPDDEERLRVAGSLEMIDGVAMHIVRPDGLASLFQGCRKLECVVLNTCTGHLLGQEFLQYVKYVISVRGRISDVAAINFSEGFYSALLSDSGDVDIEAAYCHGCAALKSYSPKARLENKLVEEDGGKPQLHIRRPSPPPTPAARCMFEIFARASDVDTKEGLVSYLESKLRRLDLCVNDGDIEVHELSATFNIVLHERDDFVISRAAGEKLVRQLNSKFSLCSKASIEFEDISSGSIILSVRSSPSTLSHRAMCCRCKCQRTAAAPRQARLAVRTTRLCQRSS